MKNQESSTVFDKELAVVYNKRLAKFDLLFDALYLLTRLVLSELPANARILCVGVGTGTELNGTKKSGNAYQLSSL